MAPPLLRIGARGSPLSLAQTEGLRALLAERLGAAPEALPLTPITTTGDRIQDRTLQAAGGKGLFTKELDEALLAGTIDLAVHSLKDLPTRLPAGIALVAVSARADARDAFISPHADTLEALRAGAVLGTASLRRAAQARHVRPDLRVVPLRGNVDTRLAKIADGAADATFLAVAGLARLGLLGRVASILDPLAFPPAAGQGALAVTARAGDAQAARAAALVSDPAAGLAAAAERAFLDGLDGSCRTAIGAYARVAAEELVFVGEVLTPDGARRWRREGACTATLEAAQSLGAALAADIRAEAGAALHADHG